jgi:uncharacterized repeat protein (TIGR01451 family)
MRIDYLADGSTTIPAWPPSLNALDMLGYTGVGLPNLPATATELSIQFMPALETLPTLPAGLLRLSLGELPALAAYPAFPSGLEYAYFNNLPFSATPVLPDGLDELAIVDMDLVTNVDLLPGQLRILECGYCDALFTISPVPVTLETLRIRECPMLTTLPADLSMLTGTLFILDAPSLTALPNWGDQLERLYLHSMDQFTSIPVVPAQLGIYEIGGMAQLQELPAIPESVLTVTVNYLPLIQELPPLPPQLTDLTVSALPMVTCLPPIPSSVTYVFLDSEQVTCLPNPLPPGTEGYVSFDTSAVCTILTSICPTLFTRVQGTVYHDVNANGIKDSGEQGLAGATLRLDTVGGSGGVIMASNANGRFDQLIRPGDYEVRVVLASPYQLAVQPEVHPAVLASVFEVDSLNDFGVTLPEDLIDHSVQLHGQVARPGFSTSLDLVLRNVGVDDVPTTLTLVLDADVQYVDAQPSPTSVNGTTLIWEVASLTASENLSVNVDLHIDAAVPLGTEIQHAAAVDPAGTDLVPVDNSVAWSAVVVGSYDPNDKTVRPAEVEPEEVVDGVTLDYLIRFQNTGTYAAERVLITDTLDQDLQDITVQVTGRSHPMEWWLEDGVLHFLFDGIDLPDSTSDEPGSHGHVTFTIQLADDLPPGAAVANIANIYFDFNPPVITEPAVVIVVVPQHVRRNEQEYWSVQPNPAQDFVYLHARQPVHFPVLVDICDVSGRLQRVQTLSSLDAFVDLRGLGKGAYFLRVHDAARPSAVRIVKQ